MNAAFFFHQWFHETIDDTGRKQRCEAHPVYPVIVQVVRVFISILKSDW